MLVTYWNQFFAQVLGSMPYVMTMLDMTVVFFWKTKKIEMENCPIWKQKSFNWKVDLNLWNTRWQYICCQLTWDLLIMAPICRCASVTISVIERPLSWISWIPRMKPAFSRLALFLSVSRLSRVLTERIFLVSLSIKV